MRRAWRRDIRERKHRRMSTVAQTATDPLTAGNNDKTWDQITEDENLQRLLYDFFMMESRNTEAFGPAARLQEWLENNVAGCAAEIFAATRWDQAAYCDNPVEPECGEFCMRHREMDG